MALKLTALGKTVLYDESTTFFSLADHPQSYMDSAASIPPIAEIMDAIKPTSYTFCIDVSDACNLRCDYCFNQSKTGRIIDSQQALFFLERMFSRYPDGEKYFVDMSGKGEPLLALPVIFRIAKWCKSKQDQIRREVLPQFVCNGSLLTPEISRALQSTGILFGVSLDGDKETHDKHRKDAFGQPTFDRIIENVKRIEFRDYVGCAATLTQDVFPLTQTIDYLLPIFKTISFRPARGAYGFDEASERLWELEYERLGYRLLSDIRKEDPTVFLALMNGEDYFGRYLFRTIGSQRTITRCDASISRFAIDIDGHEYPCPACCEMGAAASEGNKLHPFEDFSLRSQAYRCSECPFKYICGGECPLAHALGNVSHDVMCRFRKKLITIAMVLTATMECERPNLYERLVKFCMEKGLRQREDPELTRFLSEHSELSFTEAKKAFDDANRRY